MSRKVISSRELRRLLLGIGFAERPTKGSHQVLVHLETHSVIVLPGISGRLLPKSHMAAVRRTIVENGVMTLGEFERLLEGK